MYRTGRKLKTAASCLLFFLGASFLAGIFLALRVELEMSGVWTTGVVTHVQVQPAEPNSKSTTPSFTHLVRTDAALVTLNDSKRFEPGTQLKVAYLPGRNIAENVETLTPLPVLVAFFVGAVVLTIIFSFEIMGIARDAIYRRGPRRVYESDVY